MKTCQEIEALKDNWRKDPCWDIEDTEGFEAHYDELLAYRKQRETQWETARQKRLEGDAADMGLTVQDCQRVQWLERDAKNSANAAKRLLTHYFGVIREWDRDCEEEQESIIDSIVEAAVSKVEAKLLRQKGVPQKS